MCEKFRAGYAATIVASLLLVLNCGPVYAYLGPGGAVSGIGALLALIGAVLLSIIGFVWYPVKRMLTRRRKTGEVDDDNDNDDEPSREKPEQRL